MKKILKLFTYNKSKYGPLYTELFSDNDIKTYVKNMSEFYVYNWDLYYLEDNKKFNPKDFDIVWQYITIPMSHAFYLINKKTNLTFIDKDFFEKSYLHWKSKIVQSILQRQNNLNSIDDVYFLINLDEFSVDKYVSIVVKKLGLPVVAKEVKANRGEWVFLVKTVEELKDIILKYDQNKDWLIFQKYVENDWDYRLVYFKDKFVFAAKRIWKWFLNNLCAGWKLQKAEVPSKIIEELKWVWKIFWLDIVWVDIFIKNNTYKIIEINHSPQIAWFSDIYAFELKGKFKKMFFGM